MRHIPVAFALLIVLHNVDGSVVIVNPKSIATLHERREDPSAQVIAKGVNCTIGLTSGKILSVVETCATVQKLIDDVD